MIFNRHENSSETVQGKKKKSGRFFMQYNGKFLKFNLTLTVIYTMEKEAYSLIDQ